MNDIESEAEQNENKPSVRNLRKSEKVVTWFLDYYYKYIAAKDVKIDPFDTVILKAHYRFTSHLLLTVFILVTSHWFIDEPIICVDRSDKSRAPDDLLDICATYPYVEYPFNNDRNNMVRRYALHYRWVHIACLILSFVYKAVVLMKKIFYFKKHREMLEEICKVKLLDRFWIAKRYFSNYKSCHKNMYARFLYVHLSAFMINIVCFAGLNITFQNQYWDLPKNLFVKRDPTTFHDSYSLIFPPFVKCDITPVHHILVLRHKYFGCHLPLMEFYEKIFMMFWFWQVFLGIWTSLYILYNTPLPFFLSWKRRLLIYGKFNQFEPFSTCVQRFTTDDIFALRSVTNLMLGDEFARLVSHLIRDSGDHNDSLNLDETVYLDQEQTNKDSANSTLFQSCIQEEKEQNVPIGFEGLVASTPLQCTSFNPVSSSSAMHSIPENNFTDNPYAAWKRSISLESGMFKLNSFGNAKMEPLTQYLHRDMKIGKNTTTSLSHPVPTAPRSSPPNILHKTWAGGEKDIEENWDNADQQDTDKSNNQWDKDIECGQEENVLNEIEDCWDNEERWDNSENFSKRW